MTLGERISGLRKEKNYSQEFIAHELDISRQAVYKWEKDLSSPDTAHLIKLAEVLDVSVEYLAIGKVESDLSVVSDATDSNRKKRNPFKTAIISIVCIFSAVVVICVAFIATRPISWDSGACSGGFTKTVWDMYRDNLFEKYLEGFDDNLGRELIEDSWGVIYKEKTIVIFFDVAVTDENGVSWTDYIHFKGKRIWTMKYVFGNCILSEKLSPDEYYTVGYND